jgi:sugar lactone lactonase YvrE
LLGAASVVLSPRATRADLFVTDYQGPSSVLRFDENTGAFLGNIPSGGPGLNGAYGVTFGPDGNLYVSDALGDAINRYNGASGASLGVFATNGIYHPYAMAFGPDGLLYVSNNNAPGISVLDGRTGAFVAYVTNSLLAYATGLQFGPDGALYVADGAVLRYDLPTQAFSVFIPTNFFSNGGARDLCFGPDGSLYVSDSANNRVLRFRGQEPPLVITSPDLVVPVGVSVGPDGTLYVVKNNYTAGSGHKGVLRYDATTGAYLGEFLTYGPAPACCLEQLAFTPRIRAGIRSLGNSEVEISWNSISNVTYRVDYCPNLATKSWAPLVSCIMATNGTTRVLDSMGAGGVQRYYRVVSGSCVP